MAIVSTYGDVKGFTTSALMGLGATEADANGRFYLDGSAVGVELSRAIAEAIYIQNIFREGQSVTGKYTTQRERGGAVRVILDTPLPFSSRTTSFGGRKGTPGNGGSINVNAPQLPANDEFMVYLNQVNDQMMAFPDLSREYIPLDFMAARIASYSKRVAEDRSASTLAEILCYAFFRSLNDGGNLVSEGDLTQDNAYADLINELNTLLDNGDITQGAHTFPTEGRTIIGRPSFINKLFSRKSGVILMGGDLSQTMLKDYNLDASMSDRTYVGTGYKGYAMNMHFQSAPDYIWTLAEAYMGLPKGALDAVDAICVSYEATAVANGVDLGVKVVDGNGFRGSLVQPLNMWGHEAFRKSYVIGKTDSKGDPILTNTYLTSFGFTDSERRYPVAPADAAASLNQASDVITVPVYGVDGTVVGYKQVASVPNPNGGNIASGLQKVASVKASKAPGKVTSGTTVQLTTDTADAEIYYTDNGTDPTTNSTKYTSAITISAAKTIKAIAVKQGMIPSDIGTFAYTV